MRSFATTLGLGALLLAAPATFAQATFQAVATGTITTKVFNNGILHGSCDAATVANPWFLFGGVDGGCGGGFMVGLSATNVLGDGYLLTAAHGWTGGSQGASTVFPYPGLTSGVRAAFSNITNNLAVESNHYWGAANPDFIVHHYVVTNNGSAPLTGVYTGMFWDYDVLESSPGSNTAVYDAANQLIYVQQTPTATTPAFGMMAVSGTVSGYEFTLDYAAAGQPHPAAARWAGLTVNPGTTTSAAADQRGIIGTGPYTIPAGGSITVVFAEVAGTNPADIIANAGAVRAAVVTSTEGAPTTGALRLDAPAPNPSQTASTFTFELTQAGNARLSVYDVLGRTVATLVDNTLAAGVHTAVLDAANLPNGTYVVRLEAEGTQAVRTLAVSH